MAKGVFNDHVLEDRNEEIDVESRLTKLETQHTHILSSLIRIEDKIDSNLVTHHEFWPVRTIVYTGAGIVLCAVLTGVIALVIRNV